MAIDHFHKHGSCTKGGIQMPEDAKLKVSLLQMDVAFGDPEENRRRAEAMINEALKQKKKPDVLVLPEMWTTGYDLARICDIADMNGRPTVKWLQEVAGRNRVNIVVGSIADARQGITQALADYYMLAGFNMSEPDAWKNRKPRVYNSCYIINREGKITARYDKVHRFRLMGEDMYLGSGEEAVVFELDGITCGVVICYDLRFPEFVRKLALMGAKVLFVPAQWPEPREMHWKLLNIVRAIENQMFVVAVNRSGEDESGKYPGMSLVVDPWGEVLLEGGSRQEVLTATLDLSRIDHARKKITVFEDRRPELY